MTSSCHALIPAAGIGTRTGTSIPKQYLPIAGQPMLVHVLAAFAASPAIERIVVVVARDDRRFDTLELDGAIARRIDVVRAGGATRDATVRNGLDAMRSWVAADDWVLVHDAARCGIASASIEALIAAVAGHAVGGLLALPLDDTVKREVAATRLVEGTVDRRGLWRAQTPQMFRHRLLHGALVEADARGIAITDEASAIEATGLRPLLVAGSPRNFKVTTADDLAMMDLLLRATIGSAPGERTTELSDRGART